MQRFSLSFIALCLFVAVLASALPAQNKRSGPADEAFNMVDKMMNDPALQSGGGMGQGTVITPTNGSGSKPTPTPSPSPSSTPAAHGPAGATSSSTPVAAHSAKPSHTPSATKAAVPTHAPTPSSDKDKGGFMQKIPFINKLTGFLGL